MYFWALIMGLLILTVWSIWLRVCHLRTVDSGKVKPSPVALAIQELVATAGGVYLSMVALVSFLRLNIPEQLGLAGITFDPLALLAICIALTQPWWGKLFIDKAEK